MLEALFLGLALASFGTIGTENRGTSNAFPVYYYGQMISFGDHTLGEQIKSFLIDCSTHSNID